MKALGMWEKIYIILLKYFNVNCLLNQFFSNIKLLLIRSLYENIVFIELVV